MKTIARIAALAALTGAGAANAAISLDATAYTQNFNSLANTAGVTNSGALPAGWVILEGGNGARDNELYAVDTGGSNTGDVYSYGSAGSTDRALGTLRSSSLLPTFGASFTNAGASAITALSIGYTGEQWRLGTAGRADSLTFQYSLDATSLSTGTWTTVSSLNFSSPNTVAPLNAKDGNLAINRTALTGTITGLNIAANSNVWIRWNDIDASGADDGLGVDDFQLAATFAPTAPVPEPGEWAMMTAGLGVAGYAGRRRKKA